MEKTKKTAIYIQNELHEAMLLFCSDFNVDPQELAEHAIVTFMTECVQMDTLERAHAEAHRALGEEPDHSLKDHEFMDTEQ